MTKKIKLGVVGMGRMGITHFSIINTHPHVIVQSIADPSPMVTSLLNKYLNLRSFKEYSNLLDETDLNGILVCTPPDLHYPIIKSAADRGLHVFVEKPFTTSLNYGRELLSLFEQRNLIHQVGYVLRYNDCFVKAKEILNKRILGDIYRFKVEKYSSTITSSDDSSGWRAKRESGGGAVFEMASHAIDLVNYLIGKPDKVIGTTLTQIHSKNVEDAVTSTFLYSDGKAGYIDINWSDTSYRKPASKVEIFGVNGKIIVNEHSLKIFLNEANTKENLLKGWTTFYVTDVFRNVPFYVRGNEFTRQLYDFADSIFENSAKSLCTFKDGVDTLEIIQLMFNDARN